MLTFMHRRVHDSQADRRGWGRRMPGRGEQGPAYQLHAQAVLLPTVIALNLLLDLLERGRVLCLLHCLTDILDRQRSGVCTAALRM